MIPFEPFDKIIGAFLGRGFEDASEEFFQLKQVHGDRIVTLRNRDEARALRQTEGDAVICSAWGVPIAVRTADCVPIFVVHPQRVISVVHAGWRGTRGEILRQTLLRMSEEFDLDPALLRVAIGPAICGACYEVGEDVASALRREGQGEFLLPLPAGKFLLDLKSANVRQALTFGVPAAQIEVRSECTLCQESDFFSYRGAQRKGESSAGRNYSWLMISP